MNLVTKSDEERLRVWGMFSLKKRKLKYLKGSNLEEGTEQFHSAADSLFSLLWILSVERYQLDIRKNNVTVRVVQQRNRLPKEAVSSSSLAVFKQRLDRYFSWML